MTYLVRTATLTLIFSVSAHASDAYQSITVRNFVIDGPQLAAHHAKVTLIGSYILNGNIGMLYTDAQAVIMANHSNSGGTSPSVALSINGASRRLREAILFCDSTPSTAQIGCQIEVRGKATMCDVTNVFGATRTAPCLDAEDGGHWYPPPPTPEEIQAQKKAQEGERAEQIREALATQQAMQEKYRECLHTMRIYQGTSSAYLITSVCGNSP